MVFAFGFQSCDDVASSVSTNIEKIKDNKSGEKGHSEMSSQELTEYVAKHTEHLSFVNTKMKEIKNENIVKKDFFNFNCENGNASIERLYNDKGKIHLLTTSTLSQDSTTSSVKHHYYWEDKLIYQDYHHVVRDGSTMKVDDHKTYFKDGELLKCLEREYNYQRTENEPHDIPYKIVDLDPGTKLTKDLNKLVTLPEEEIKTFLCK